MAENTLTPSQRRTLEMLSIEPPCNLTSYVAHDILDQDDPLCWMVDLLRHGCASGMVPGLIYYVDTHLFFDRHYYEIEDLRQEYEDMTGFPLHIKDDLKNELAWFAYEETARLIADKLGISY